MKTKTLVVNLYGAPGAGKSTGAAYIFYKLKQSGINCELVTEFAKDKVWEGAKAVFEDGCYIFGKQHFRMHRLMGKVDVVITDSPLLVSAFYSPDEFRDELTSIAKKSFDKFQVSYFINRVKTYNPKGRFQTEHESDQVAYDMWNFLINNGVEAFNSVGNEEGYNAIVDDILGRLGRTKPTLERIPTLEQIADCTKTHKPRH